MRRLKLAVLAAWAAAAVLAVVLVVDARSSSPEGTDVRSASSAGPSTSTSSTTAAPATSSTTTTTVAKAKKKWHGERVYALGTKAKTSDLEVTLLNVEDPMPSDVKPEADRRFVAVEVEVHNTSDDRQVFSILIGAQIVDSLSQTWNVSFIPNRPSPDGDILAGQSRRGWIAFQVGTASTELHLRIKGSLTAQGALFTLG